MNFIANTPVIAKTTTVTVFARHATDCPKKADSQWKRCKCRKSMYIYKDGKTTMVSCKTRSWEQAEQIAQKERDKYDPIKIALSQIEKRKQTELTELTDALKQWIASLKIEHQQTLKIYNTMRRKLTDWAQEKNLRYIQDVTPALLDEWRGNWSVDAKRIDDRMSPNTQSSFQDKLKRFFTWAVAVDILDKNPTRALRAISFEREHTMPLTSDQYEELLRATALYDYSKTKTKKLAANVARTPFELKTLFTLMRHTGLRLGDGLMLSRRSLIGNTLTLKTVKTNKDYEGPVPDSVVEALYALPRSNKVHPDYFFWSGTGSYETLVSNWTRVIKEFNEHLSFKDERGETMAFHSHMLRDTFAVEMLLAGMAIEDVSRLLTHSSIATTERYYARWVKARKRQLQDKAIEAMRRQGLLVGGV